MQLTTAPVAFAVADTRIKATAAASPTRRGRDMTLRRISGNSEVLCASISAYLLLGVVWTFAYWLIAELIPGAFALSVAAGSGASMKDFNGIYYSFITLSTVGCGDITPVANVAKMLAAVEGITGVLYVAVLIARLVSIQAAYRPREDQGLTGCAL
jgi:hypothetical protein